MGKKMMILAVAGMVVFGMGFEAMAREQEFAVGKEELLFMEIPIVVTAARKEQKITEAPATVFVVRSEDIKQSGATNIPDVLRMVPGIDIMAITVRNQEVGVRGLFFQARSDRLLVLIDGRSVQLDIYGNTFWNFFPVGLSEIERIEIVRSPTSSLYGANAYCGVINIITKVPSQIKGTELTVSGGDYDTLIGSVLHSGVSEKIDYKVSAEYDMTNEWRDKDEKAGEITRGNAFVEYRANEKNKFAFSGGRNHFKNAKYFPVEAQGTGKVAGDLDYLQFDCNYSDIKFRTFMKREDFDVKWQRTGEMQLWLTTTYDTELQHSVNIRDKNSIILGGNYRYNTLDRNSFIPDNERQNLLALFAEDEFRLTDKLRLTSGVRYDWHPLSGEHFSPRGNISYSPAKDHVIRLSAANAYRNPTHLHSYLYIESQLTIDLPSPFPPVNVPFIVQGNKNLKSEGITSYEMGYLSTWLSKVKFNMNMFYNEYIRFFTVKKDITYYAAGELGFPHPGGLIPKRIVNTIDNGGDAWGIGGEAGMNIFITDYLSATANYSYQQVTDKDDDLATISVNEKGRVRPDYPKNKVNVGLRLRSKDDISANVIAHWVDKTKRIITDLKGNEYLSELRDYTIFNTRIGYTLLDERAEVSLSVFNLFNDMHYEYPVGINLPDYSSDEIGRKITGKVSYKF